MSDTEKMEEETMFSLEVVKEQLSGIDKLANADRVNILEAWGNEAEKEINIKIGIDDLKDSTAKQVIEGHVNYKLKLAGAKEIHVLFVENEKKIEEENILNTKTPPKFLAVASGKGGVGKSTVTANLAKALQRMGKQVAIIDADIYGPSIPGILGITEKPEKDDEKFIPADASGIKVMSMGFFQKYDEPVMWRGPMLGRMLETFFKQTRWGYVDVMLLDLPPGTGDIAIDVNTLVPNCQELIVTTPHPTAAYVAIKAGHMGKKLGQSVIGVIENMSYIELPDGTKQHLFGQGGGEKLAEDLSVPLIGVVPMGEHPDVFDDIAKKIMEQ